MWRRQPPAHSPLDGRAVASGLRALVTGRSRAEAKARELLRDRFGARRTVLTDSGTSALILALRAATEIRAGPVAVPAYSCYDVATAWVGAGLRPHLYDLDPWTLGPEPASLASVARDDASAIVVAYLYGTPIDWATVREVAGDSGILLIEDAAQGIGCGWRGRRAGSLGDVSVLSFGRGKGWTAGGGGALLALTDRGEEAVSRVEADDLTPAASASALARTVAQWAFGRPSLYGVPTRLPGLDLGETVYREPPSPESASTFSLGMLPATLALQDRELAARRGNAARLREVAEVAPDVTPVRSRSDGTSGALRLPVLADGNARRRLGSRRALRLGVMPGYPRSLHELPQVRGSLEPGPGVELPGSRRLATELFTLPTHSLLRPRDLLDLEDLLLRPSGGIRVHAEEDGDRAGRVEPFVKPFAALAVLSFLAYLVSSQAVRAFGEWTGILAGRLLEVLA